MALSYIYFSNRYFNHGSIPFPRVLIGGREGERQTHNEIGKMKMRGRHKLGVTQYSSCISCPMGGVYIVLNITVTKKIVTYLYIHMCMCTYTLILTLTHYTFHVTHYTLNPLIHLLQVTIPHRVKKPKKDQLKKSMARSGGSQ